MLDGVVGGPARRGDLQDPGVVDARLAGSKSGSVQTADSSAAPMSLV